MLLLPPDSVCAVLNGLSVSAEYQVPDSEATTPLMRTMARAIAYQSQQINHFEGEIEILKESVL